jgi:putative PIN family toxin of toxin-antitoxin system
MKMLIALDTNILVAGLSSRNCASNRILEHLLDGAFTLLATPALWLEYEAILKRDVQRHGFSAAEIDTLLDSFAQFALPVRLHYLWRPQLRDAGDEMVLELAVNGQAHALVTHNTRDFTAAAPRFSLRVQTPSEFLKLLESTL